MPFDKLSLAAMTATDEEFIDKVEIANRLAVTERTVERLIEKFRRKLRKHSRRQGRKIAYLWSDVLKYAKIYAGIERENVPSAAIMRAYSKQRIKELESEIERLKNNVSNVTDQLIVTTSRNNPRSKTGRGRQ